MRLVSVFIISFFILLTGFSPARPQDVSLTLEDAILIAARDNRDLLLKQEDVSKASAAVREARAAGLPSVTLAGSWSDTRELYSKDINTGGLQVSLRQPLFKGGSVTNTIRYNEFTLKASEALLDKGKMELIAQVRTAFYTLLLARELAGLNQAIAENTRAHYDALQEKYLRGELSDYDTHKAFLAIQNTRQEYESAQRQVEVSGNALKALLALDPAVDVHAVGELDYQLRDLACDEAFLKALALRPEIRQYEAQVQAARVSVEIARAGMRPSVEASWDYYLRSRVSVGGVTSFGKNMNDYNIIGVTLSWPVFDGWATKAKVEQALAGLRQAQLAQAHGLQAVALDVRNAYVVLQDALGRLHVQENDAEVYKRNYETIQARYQQGMVSRLDQDDAALKYSVALFNRKQAAYDYLVARSGFQRATGGF